MIDFERQIDSRGVTHYILTRNFFVDEGDGNVGNEELDVSLCDVHIGLSWSGEGDVVTCVACLAEHMVLVRWHGRLARVVSARMSCG